MSTVARQRARAGASGRALFGSRDAEWPQAASRPAEPEATCRERMSALDDILRLPDVARSRVANQGLLIWPFQGRGLIRGMRPAFGPCGSYAPRRKIQ